MSDAPQTPAADLPVEPPFRILSMDGGGLRGSFGAGFLTGIAQRLGGSPDLVKHFDLIAGTSTGGILAAGLAAGFPPERLVRFYREQGPEIFTPRPKYKPKLPVRAVYPLVNAVFKKRTGQPMDSLFRARYCPLHLRDAFADAFGEMTLADLSSARLAIPAVNLTRGEIHLFRTYPKPGTHALEEGGLSVNDVLVAATAAPSYFPHKEIDGEGYCDGGVWANNPTVLAVAEAVALESGSSENTGSTGMRKAIEVASVHVLNVGTGTPRFSLSPPGGDAGGLYWAKHIAEVMGNAAQQGAVHPSRFFLGERLTRVSFDVPDPSWTLDAADKIPDLLAMGAAAAEDLPDADVERFFG